jgi:hypothetical protein
VVGVGEPDGDDVYSRFLLDGFRRNPSPLVTLVTEPSLAQEVALRLHQGAASDMLPEARGGLVCLEAGRGAGLSSQQAHDACAQVAATEDWLYMDNFDVLLDSSGGKHFLTALTDSVANGDLAAVIVSTRPERFERLRSGARRLMGFAVIAEGPRPDGTFEASTSITIAREAKDRTDTGWMIAVRYELAGPITPYAKFDPGADVADAVVLADKAYVIGSAEEPFGAMIGLRADAFTLSQEEVAFTTATKVAQRLVGRRLEPDESMKVTRAIYYA